MRSCKTEGDKNNIKSLEVKSRGFSFICHYSYALLRYIDTWGKKKIYMEKERATEREGGCFARRDLAADE